MYWEDLTPEEYSEYLAFEIARNEEYKRTHEPLTNDELDFIMNHC